MPELTHWQEIVVPQRNKRTGCVPTGFEWITKYMDIKEVNFSTFQEEFDRAACGRGDNSFEKIAEEIEQKYPHIHYQIKGDFEDGNSKIACIKKLTQQDIPCLLSYPSYVSLCPCRIEFHIVPVVSIDDLKLKVVCDAENNCNQTSEFLTSNVICWHNAFKGGHDIAWLPKKALSTEK
jgi:hypothetical protein